LGTRPRTMNPLRRFSALVRPNSLKKSLVVSALFWNPLIVGGLTAFQRGEFLLSFLFGYTVATAISSTCILAAAVVLRLFVPPTTSKKRAVRISFATALLAMPGALWLALHSAAFLWGRLFGIHIEVPPFRGMSSGMIMGAIICGFMFLGREASL